MKEWHHVGSWILIITNAAAGAWALAAHWIPRLRGPLLWAALALAQATTFFQAITGAIMMTRDDLEPRQLHAAYGFSAIIAVGILYSYRTAPWMKGKQYLLYGLGSLFIMGLGLRELVLS